MENQNLTIYNSVRKVPDTAKREIGAGRLKGKTDINPMWRIKTLTELFGPAGQNWNAEIVERWVDRNETTGEAIANVRIKLHVFFGATAGGEDVEWYTIDGIGGAMLIANESKGIFTDDEAWKKAYTDAISVACKALGIGADVYWDKDATKYTAQNKTQDAPQRTEAPKAGKDTTESTKRATAQNLGAQSAQGHAQAQSAQVQSEPKPAILDNDYFARILMELVEGQNITYKQLEMIAARDFQKEIADLNEEERKQLYLNTKKAVEKLKAKATEAQHE